ncbi:MAG: ABC transporter ATP-binding protein, partial [Burkholderiales bacterium]
MLAPKSTENRNPAMSVSQSALPSRKRDALSDAQAQGDGTDFQVGTLLRITRMAFRYRVRMTLALGATIAATFFQMAIPQYLREAVDAAHGLVTAAAFGAEDALWSAAAFLFAFSILRGAFTMLHNYQAEAIGQAIGYKLRLAYYEKLQRLSFNFHDRVHTGDLITRGILDIEGTRLFVDAGIVRPLLLSLYVALGAYFMLSANTTLALVSLSFVPFVAWRAMMTRMNLRRSWDLLQEKLSVLTRVMEENLGGIRVVRAFAAQPHEIAKFNVISDDAMALSHTRIMYRVRNTSTMTYAYFLSVGLVLWIGGGQVVEGVLTVGQLTQFLAYMTILQMPVRQLGMVVNSIARAASSGARLFEILDLEPDIREKPDARELDLSQATLRFENVDFAFKGEGASLA